MGWYRYDGLTGRKNWARGCLLHSLDCVSITLPEHCQQECGWGEAVPLGWRFIDIVALDGFFLPWSAHGLPYGLHWGPLDHLVTHWCVSTHGSADTYRFTLESE